MIYLGVSPGGPNSFFGQFIFDVASVTCVIYTCPLMRGRASHEWTSFIVPIQGVLVVVVGGSHGISKAGRLNDDLS